MYLNTLILKNITDKSRLTSVRFTTFSRDLFMNHYIHYITRNEYLFMKYSCDKVTKEKA